jgi:hypothetical protein
MFLRTPSCQVGSIAAMALEICALSATVITSAGSSFVAVRFLTSKVRIGSSLDRFRRSSLVTRLR